MERTNAELRAAIIIAGKPIVKLNFGRRNDPVLRILRRDTITTVQGHLAAPQILFALCASMLVFSPEWKARIQRGPLSAAIGISAILFVVGYMAAAGISYR
jgi:hypothetical protein